MNRDVQIDIEGLRDLRRALKQAGVDVGELKAANHTAGQLVATEAARRAPRRSGRLAGSGRAAKTAGAAIVRFGSASIPYAGVIHFGWAEHNIAPQPFAYDALDARRDQVINAYRNDVDRILKRI